MFVMVRESQTTFNYLTQEGYDKLQEELDYLRKVKRIELAERLHEAYEGDGYDEISEPVYDAVRHEQAFCEGNEEYQGRDTGVTPSRRALCEQVQL